MPISIRQRRSQRIILDVPLVSRGVAADKKIFQEETFSLIVNAHGAMLMMERKVAVGQRVVVMNPKNWDECLQSCLCRTILRWLG